MRPVFSLVLFGPLVLQALAAPVHNAEAGPSGSTDHAHAGGSQVPVKQLVTVEYGKVYGSRSQESQEWASSTPRTLSPRTWNRKL